MPNHGKTLFKLIEKYNPRMKYFDLLCINKKRTNDRHTKFTNHH
jgi:hypothetical protein